MTIATTSKTALITGGTKGLGLATAHVLATRGYGNFLLAYRKDETAATEAKRTLEAKGARVHLLAVDLTEADAVPRLWDWVAAEAPQGIDLYVHNAAATAFKPLLDLEGRHFDKTFALSARSFFESLPRGARQIRSGGAIVTVSGMDTTRAVPLHGLLAAAKASLEMLTKYAAHEMAIHGIRVNGVNPGFFPSESTRKYLGPMFDPIEKFIAAGGPYERSATLEEIARVIAFLASDDAQWMVGQILHVDGGQGFSMPMPQSVS